MMEAKGLNLLRKLINGQTLPGIMSHAPSQLAAVGQGEVFLAARGHTGTFWLFTNQKWRESFNVAVVDSTGSEASKEAKWLATEGLRKPTPEGQQNQLRPR
jgi:hypothetical protein